MENLTENPIENPAEEPEEDPTEARLIRLLSDGRRLDVQLAEAAAITRSRAAGLMAEGLCAVAGKPVTKAGEKPKAGAEILLTIPAPRPAAPQPEDIPLTILYEDEDLAVIVKPCGMVVHPGPGNEDGTLVNALLYHLSGLSSIGGEMRPGIVHRLDKDTSGLLLVAKNDAAHFALSRQFQDRETEKHYRALVEGIPREPGGRIELSLGRSPVNRKMQAVVPLSQGGRMAVTEWQTLRTGRGCALLDVHILTGRTHQIRVHMRSIGHPVCGDTIYGQPRGLRVPRLMLHAWSLAFRHPRTGEAMAFTAPLPEDFLAGLRAGGIEEAP